MTGTNTDDTENDADDNDEVNSIASSVPPCLIDGMSKFFTPSSRQRKHSNEASDASVHALLKAASSKLNKSMESNKSDASSSHKSTSSSVKNNAKKQSSLNKKSVQLYSKKVVTLETENEIVSGEASVSAILNNSDKENQSKQPQLTQPSLKSAAHHAHFENEDESDEMTTTKSQQTKSKLNTSDASRSKSGTLEY